MFYYKQVLGLSGTLTGLAIAISVLWDAVSDPLVGAWSDNLRGRWGRRHPLMIASVLPLALSFVAVFSPPAIALESQTRLFLWLLASVILLRTALTFFMIPYLALGAEMTSDYHERTRLSRARTTFGWFMGVAVAATAMYFLFGERAGSDGRFVVENYHYYGWLSAAGVLLFSSICIIGTWHHIPNLLGAVATRGSNLLRNIASTFRNRNFRFIVFLETALGGIGGITAALVMVTSTYFWELNAVEISLLIGGPPLLAIAVIATNARLFDEKLEKQQVLRLSCVIGALNLLWLTPLKLLGWLPDHAGWIFALVFINATINVGMSILRTISNLSLLADIADEYELESGKRQEGVMFAAAFFAAKFISGFGYLVAGPFLDLIGLEAGALPGEVGPNVILGLGLMMGPALALLMAIPVWMSFKLRVSLAEQAAVRQALREREQTP